jgi:hypothetical protein
MLNKSESDLDFWREELRFVSVKNRARRVESRFVLFGLYRRSEEEYIFIGE